jgi:hypothetical protein
LSGQQTSGFSLYSLKYEDVGYMIIKTFKCIGTAHVVNLERWLTFAGFLTAGGRGPAAVVFLW